MSEGAGAEVGVVAGAAAEKANQADEQSKTAVEASAVAAEAAKSAQESAWNAQDAVAELRSEMTAGFEAVMGMFKKNEEPEGGGGSGGDGAAAAEGDVVEPEKNDGPKGAKPAEGTEKKKRRVAWR